MLLSQRLLASSSLKEDIEQQLVDHSEPSATWKKQSVLGPRAHAVLSRMGDVWTDLGTERETTYPFIWSVISGALRAWVLTRATLNYSQDASECELIWSKLSHRPRVSNSRTFNLKNILSIALLVRVFRCNPTRVKESLKAQEIGVAVRLQGGEPAWLCQD